MKSLAPGYRIRLNALTFVCLVGLAALPGVLGFAVAGVEASLGVWLACGFLGVVRFGRVGLPGTFPVSPAQAPGLFALVESFARRAGLTRVPEVRIVPGGQVNAAATFRGAAPVLVVTEALLERLDVRRLAAVLAHETAHLAHGDLTMFRLAQVFQSATLVLGMITVFLAVLSIEADPANAVLWTVTALVAPPISRLLVALLSRTREFAADLGAARLTGDPGALAEALAIIEYRPRTWWDWLAGRRSPGPVNSPQDAFRTHPPTPERIHRLELLAWVAR